MSLSIARQRSQGLASSGSIATGVGIAEAVIGAGMIAGSFWLYKRHPFASGAVGVLGVSGVISGVGAMVIDQAASNPGY